MNPSESTPRKEEVVEPLVAYLDGELSTSQSARIEQRLADDDQYRLRLQQLQRAWDLLDLLPRAEVGDEFTETTVAVVAVSAAGDVRKQRKTSRCRTVVGWCAVALAGLLAGVIGFRMVHLRLDQPNRQLLEDLPVVENVDLYFHAEDIRFVEQLKDSGIFAEEVETVDYAP